MLVLSGESLLPLRPCNVTSLAHGPRPDRLVATLSEVYQSQFPREGSRLTNTECGTPSNMPQRLRDEGLLALDASVKAEEVAPPVPINPWGSSRNPRDFVARRKAQQGKTRVTDCCKRVSNDSSSQEELVCGWSRAASIHHYLQTQDRLSIRIHFFEGKELLYDCGCQMRFERF
jgi:hypothetical protein